ncbi:MAG: DUF1501 domain-containing protein [Chloroflexi bacterium]|nr:DUF1501 domain-containing protein [Chloroflexota bacterium]
MTNNTGLISRRQWLQAATALSAIGATRALWPAWLPRLAFASDGVVGDTLVCIFLRGGADGLNMIVPFGDDNYYKARPVLAIGQPDSSDSVKALALDDFFGLNPDMRPLHELFMNGHMTAIHAAGSPNVSRSHFEAMDLMERGTNGAEAGIGSGWLGRHLMATSGAGDSPLRAIGWSDKLPTSLRGYVSANAMQSIADFHLHGDTRQTDQMAATLSAMYQESSTPINLTADATFRALDLVRQIDINQYHPANHARYDESDLGLGLKQTAALIKAGAGLEVACVDHGSYDTHVAQGRSDGLLSGLLTSLSQNLRAFHDDLLDYMGKVTVVVMSEFGRRVQENGGGGTDHGHGNAMYIISPHVAQTPVIAQWPGLNSDFLANGDLQITTDYRDVLCELLTNRTPNTDLGIVFPGHTPKSVGAILKD